MVNFKLNDDENLFTLYSAACAPLLTNILRTDINYETQPLSNVISELDFIEKYVTLGCKALKGVYKLQRQTHDDTELLDTPEMVSALTAASAFTKRVGLISMKLSSIFSAMSEFSAESSGSVIKKLEARVKNGERPINPACISVLDFSDDVLKNWYFIDTLSKIKVGFKNTTAVISEGKVEEQVLKNTKDVTRRQRRNPTGFHKFDFRKLNLNENSEFEDSEDTYAKLGHSTDGGSTRASISGIYHPLDTVTSRSYSSTHEDDTSNDIFEQKISCVSFHSPSQERQVIQDESADSTWEGEDRHIKRFSRIRNRVPTGHPSLMRGASDELAGIVDKYKQIMDNIALDPEAKDNTDANRYLYSED